MLSSIDCSSNQVSTPAKHKLKGALKGKISPINSSFTLALALLSVSSHYYYLSHNLFLTISLQMYVHTALVSTTQLRPHHAFPRLRRHVFTVLFCARRWYLTMFSYFRKSEEGNALVRFCRDRNTASESGSSAPSKPLWTCFFEILNDPLVMIASPATRGQCSSPQPST
jgi:hypothetical protein